MFWKNSKKPTKEANFTAFVRQDSRTTVKTSTAHSESNSSSVHNDTIFSNNNNNSNNNTIIFRSTTRTVTHQQQACVTEIHKRYTPTPEELAEMRAALLNKTETKTIASRSNKNYHQQRPLINLLPGSISNGNNNNNNSNNRSLNSPPISTSDSSRPQATFRRTTTTTTAAEPNGDSSLEPTTPTIVKIQTTDVTETSGCTITSHIEQQRIKLKGNGGSFNFTANTPMPSTRCLITNNKITDEAENFKLTFPKSSLKIKPPFVKKSNYQSPQLKRSTITPTQSSAGLSTIRTPLTTTTTTTTADSKLKYTKPSFASPLKTTKSTNHLLTLPSATNIITNESKATATAQKKSKLQPGYAYIFNNEIFDNPNNVYRVGSSADVEHLRTTFDKFKLKVHLIENATLEKISSTVRKIETKDYTHNSCIVIAILSHGARREEVSAKDGTYSIDDKILFPILRNRSLMDKPKIMFIQACKGAMEGGTALHTDSVQPGGSPNEILKCYSTFEGYVSYRSESGSIFIQSLCEFLNIFGGIKNIKEIMEMVALRVKQKSNGKQIPAITSTLTQPYVFGDYV